MTLFKDDRMTELFRKYIRDKRVLIADPNATSRSNIAAALINLGAIQNYIEMVPNYEYAEQAIKDTQYNVVIVDYNLGNNCGLGLLQTVRDTNQEMNKSLFIMVTANSSQSAVAQAAEEDVDTYILKPFSSLVLRERILGAAREKLFPNDYKKMIEKGKELMTAGNLDDALTCFDAAIKLDPAPTLACFYHGQVNMVKDLLKVAEGDYHSGLKYNRIHYKCMVGLYELMMKRELYHEAYEIVRRIARYFPANPKRLAAVIRLAIQTENYSDLEKFYQTFTEMDFRNEELTKFVCAGLVVCGKFYLQRKFNTRAFELFEKAGITGFRQTKILREVVVALVEHDLKEQAYNFLKRFPPESHKTPEFRVAQFLASSKDDALQKTIERGRELLQEGLHDPAVYRMLIISSAKVGMKRQAEQYLFDAAKRWPDQKDSFEEIRKIVKI